MIITRLEGSSAGSGLINVGLTSRYFPGGTEENKDRITGFRAEISNWGLTDRKQ
jgi:hypothetical protein